MVVSISLHNFEMEVTNYQIAVYIAVDKDQIGVDKDGIAVHKDYLVMDKDQIVVYEDHICRGQRPYCHL